MYPEICSLNKACVPTYFNISCSNSFQLSESKEHGHAPTKREQYQPAGRRRHPRYSQSICHKTSITVVTLHVAVVTKEPLFMSSRIRVVYLAFLLHLNIYSHVQPSSSGTQCT